MIFGLSDVRDHNIFWCPFFWVYTAIAFLWTIFRVDFFWDVSLPKQKPPVFEDRNRSTFVIIISILKCKYWSYYLGHGDFIALNLRMITVIIHRYVLGSKLPIFPW